MSLKSLLLKFFKVSINRFNLLLGQNCVEVTGKEEFYIADKIYIEMEKDKI